MNAWNLKVGDLIRIKAVPAGIGTPNYFLHPQSKRAYLKLIARGRPVRIKGRYQGYPCYDFRLRDRKGRLEWHSMIVMDGDDNWVRVKRRTKK